MLKTGDIAPDIALPDQTGRMRSLGEFKGKKTVLYFYPKDSTSGCTLEAREFQASAPAFAAKNAVIVGISKDSVKSHAAFAAKNGLEFTLLSDPDKRAIEAYGVLKEKKMYGKTVVGTARTTFVIDESGVIEAVFEDVKPLGHAEAVLKAL